MERSKDWLDQAIRDLDQSRWAKEGNFHEWACYCSQQAAEKAVKALFLNLHADAWGHSVSKLLEALPKKLGVSSELIEKAISLDKHYVPTRYPNGFDSGSPKDYYTKKDSEEAISNAKAIIDFCKSKIS